MPAAEGSKASSQVVGDEAPKEPWRSTVRRQLSRLIEAIRKGDDETVQAMVLELSRRHRIFAPLALVVGAFAMLFEGVKLLVTNWRLTLVQLLPAMWIWAAMFDLKAHLLHGKTLYVLRGPDSDPARARHHRRDRSELLLNAVFAFAISKPGKPESVPPSARRASTTAPCWARAPSSGFSSRSPRSSSHGGDSCGTP